MSNTISEGEIVIKDELPEAEPIKALQVPAKIDKIDNTEKIVVAIAENKLERFEISTLTEENPPNQASTIPVPSKKEHVIFVVPPLQSRDDKFTCKICNKSITVESYHTLEFVIEHHLRGHNEKTCQICGNEFQNARLLWQHSTVHSEPRDFQCDVCKKSFKTRSHLVQHKSIHLTEKAFKCSLCEKAFKQKRLMKGHERRYHGVKRPFICPDCGLDFKSNKLLQVHQEKNCKNKEINC
jgi:uncharacterized Zn-finger protein